MKGHTSSSMTRTSNNRNFGPSLTFGGAKDFISAQKMRLEAKPDKSVTDSRILDSVKYAN